MIFTKADFFKSMGFFLLAVAVLILIVISNSMADFFGGRLYYVFYQGIYGIILSTIIPLVYVLIYENGRLSDLGIKPATIRSIVVAAIFICFTIGGQLLHKSVRILPFGQMIYISIPFIMTTFFEEFLFRGFFQIRFERIFGTIPAIILSGLLFSIYHLGYPDFREVDMLITLFAVGIMFALSFKLSGNNLLTAYLVNLPNAILTYLIDPKMFPDFTPETAIVSIGTIILAGLIFWFIIGRQKREGYILKYIDRDLWN